MIYISDGCSQHKVSTASREATLNKLFYKGGRKMGHKKTACHSLRPKYKLHQYSFYALKKAQNRERG